MSQIRVVAAVLATGMLAGCARTHIYTRRQAFHRFAESAPGETYAFVPIKDQEQSLEYRSYQELVRQQFVRLGWTEAPIEKAEMVVSFQSYIDNGQAHTVNMPMWGQTGVSGSTTTGTITSYGNAATYSGTTTYRPTYGVTGFVPVSRTVFTRRMDLFIFSGADLRGGKPPLPVYEGKVVSQGRNAILSKIMPYLIDAIFEDFPGESGKAVELVYTPVTQ